MKPVSGLAIEKLLATGYWMSQPCFLGGSVSSNISRAGGSLRGVHCYLSTSRFILLIILFPIEIKPVPILHVAPTAPLFKCSRTWITEQQTRLADSNQVSLVLGPTERRPYITETTTGIEPRYWTQGTTSGSFFILVLENVLLSSLH